jgi:hypothetical protein
MNCSNDIFTNTRPCYSNMSLYGANGKVQPIMNPYPATILPCIAANKTCCASQQSFDHRNYNMIPSFSEAYDTSRTSLIASLTDKWIYAVTKLNDPYAVTQLFCNDGNLVATVSPTIRQGNSILEYFKWFTSLPNIKVIDKQYSITSITPDVYLNNAWVTWMWEGLEKPLVARMSFIFRKNCIYQLHSSVLPQRPDELSNNYA